MSHRTVRIVAALVAALTVTACAGPGHSDFSEQLSVPVTGPILSVQGYVIDSAEDAQRLRSTWLQMADLMKRKPGFIAADLNPGAGKSPLWVETSRWEGVAHLRAAFEDPKVRKTAAKLPPARMSHMFVASGGGRADRPVPGQ